MKSHSETLMQFIEESSVHREKIVSGVSEKFPPTEIKNITDRFKYNENTVMSQLPSPSSGKNRAPPTLINT